MADIPLTGHKLFDALWNRERLVEGNVAQQEVDGSITISPAVTSSPAVRFCSKADKCLFGRIVKAGGNPCNKCRNLVPGDYFIEEG